MPGIEVTLRVVTEFEQAALAAEDERSTVVLSLEPIGSSAFDVNSRAAHLILVGTNGQA